MPIRLQVLGGLHAFRDDVPLAWVPAQHISSALLVYLALERDVTREQLARVFWPDEELEAARHALRQALYRLRHAAGDGLIEDTGDGLRLGVPLVCDALDLERAVETSDFAAAMALYGGAFLKDVSLSASREFEAWTDRQRARFSRLHRRACRARIEALVGSGDLQLAIEAARAWVTLEPFDDEAQHRLIELLAGSGQRAEALAQYERYERLLQGEELEPLDETKALVAMLRAGEVGNGAIEPVTLPAGRAVARPTASQSIGEIARTETVPARAWRPWLRRRWPLLAPAGVVLVSMVVAAVWALRPQPPVSLYPPTREPVLVLPFEVRESSPELADIGVQAADRITAALQAENVGRILTLPAEERAAAYSQRSLRRIVARTKARTLVTGVIARRGEVLEANARVLRASDLGTVWTLGPEQGPARDPAPVLDAITERVGGAIAWYLSPWLGMDVTHPEICRPATTLAAVRLMNRSAELGSGEVRRTDESVRLRRDAFARDTTWLRPAVGLMTTYGNLGWWRERDSVMVFLEARRERLALCDILRLNYWQAGNRSPEDQYKAAWAWYRAEPRSAYYVMVTALRARRPEETLEYYPRFRPRDPADAWVNSWEQNHIIAAQAYHMLGRFEDELALARNSKNQAPRYLGHWEREVSALAALGRTGDIERLITESHGLEVQGAPARLLLTAAVELALHGRTREARGYAARTLEGLAQWPDSLSSVAAIASGATTAMTIGEMQQNALRILGRHAEIVRLSDELARASAPAGLGWRLLGMRSRVVLRDTTRALAMVDSARTQPLEKFGRMRWSRKGAPMYYGAQILSLLGRKDEARALLREALNNGWRLGPDEPLQWYWKPIKDYPPFQELVKIR